VGLGLYHLQEKVESSHFTIVMKLPNQKNSAPRQPAAFLLCAVFGLVGLALSLGCSVGALVMQVETPTPTPPKTLEPTFTLTPYRTPTFTPSPIPTDTPTLIPTPTQTPSPTSTPENQEAADQPAEQAAPPPAPVEPTATPPPAEPAATPTPAFPFNVVYYQHDTGSPGETRITGWIRLDSAPGMFKTLSNFQIKVLAPDGNSYLSELSGPGTADSTMAGTGDNHRMNTKLEIKPYTPGVYKVQLVEGGLQVSPEIEITLSAEPLQYVHFDFFKSE
jgi:hypothetical protein